MGKADRASMAFEFHGFGTMYYGKRDFWPDGSYVSTEWVILAWVPVVPLATNRITYTRPSVYAERDRSGYFIIEPLPLDLRQVLSVYAWFAAMIGSFLAFAIYEDSQEHSVRDVDVAGEICLATLAAIGATPYLLRRWARRRKAAEWERAKTGLGPPSLG